MSTNELASAMAKEPTNNDLKKENEILKQKLEALEKNQFFLDSLLNNITDSIYFKDKKSRFTLVSKSLAQLFGENSVKKLIGKTDHDFQNPDHADKALNDEKLIMKHGKPMINIIEKELWEGDIERWISTTKFPLKDKKGNIQGVFGISRDISDLKQMEISLLMKNDELTAVEEELRQTIEELQAIQEELTSKQNIIEKQNKVILNKNSELEIHRKNLEKEVEQRTNELCIAKEKAEEADLLKSSFLANMSHEIRTPMNAILGFIDLIDESEYSNEEKETFKNLIHKSGQSLLSLIDDIIDIAKIESGGLDIYSANFDICNLLSNLYLIFDNKKENNNVTLHLKPSKHYIIYSDEQRIGQILSNLLENALKFTEKGIIEFGYEILDTKIEFFVSDTGIGITEEQKPYLFDRFRKMDSNENNIYRGTGLGLAICKHIVETMCGEIWFETQLGKGTTFYFTIPI